jgi:hypothetical protein
MSLVQELTALAELHKNGSISDTEFTQAKGLLLNKPESSPIAKSDPKPHAPAQKPQWMKPWGWIVTCLAILGYCATAYVNWDNGVGLFVGLLNPVFFIGLPLGVYWLARSGELDRINESTLSPGEKPPRVPIRSILFDDGCVGATAPEKPNRQSFLSEED